MKSSLKKIILVNSWKAGVINIIETDGNAVLQGINGVGKTTILILPSLFYGARPADVMRVSSKPGKGFADRYLPYDSSYVVFEYDRDGEANLVVAYAASDGLTVQYRFCKTAFKDELFLDGNDEFIASKELRRHFQEKGVSVFSNQLNHTDYKEIILSGKRSSGKNRAVINEAKGRFSLSPRNESLVGFDTVSTSVVNGDAKIQAIKDIISNNLELRDSFVESVSGLSNTSDLKDQASILRGISDFSTNKKKISQLSVVCDEIGQLKRDFGVSKYLAKKTLVSEELKSSNLSAELDDMKNSLVAFESEYDSKKNNVKDKLYNSKREKDGFKERISALKKSKEDYMSQNIASKKNSERQGQELREQQAGKRMELDALESNYKEITHIYNQQLQTASDSCYKNIESEGRNEASELESCHEEEKISLARVDEEEKDSNRVFESRSADLNSKKEGFQGRLIHINHQIDRPTSPKLEQLQINLKSSEVDFSNSQKRLSAAKSGLIALNKEIYACDDSVRNKESDKVKVELHLNELKVKIDDCHDSIQKAGNELYFKIFELDKEKARIASRVFSKGLLRKSISGDLKVVGKSDVSLLGFEIDGGDLEPYKVLSKAEAEDSLSKLEEEKSHFDKKLKQLNKDVNDLDRKRLSWNNDRNKLNSNILLIENEIVSKETRVEGDKEYIQIEEKSLVNRIKEDKVGVELAFSKLEVDILSLKDKKKSTDKSTESSKNKIKVNFSNRIRGVKEVSAGRRKEYAKNLEHEKQEIEIKKGRDLESKGARHDEIKQCTSQMSKNESRLKQLASDQSEYAEYYYWVNNEYSKLEEYETKYSQHKSDFRRHSSEEVGLKRSHEEGLVGRKSKIKSSRLELDVSYKEAATLKNILGMSILVDVDEEPTDRYVISADSINIEVRRLSDKANKRIKSRKLLFNSINKDFRVNGVIHQRYREYLEGDFIEDIEDLFNISVWRKRADALDHLINEKMEKDKEVIHQLFTSISHKLSNLNGRIKELEQEVSTEGRKISNQLDKIGTRYANIEYLRADIKPCLDKLPFRRLLKNISESWGDFKILPGGESPSDFFYDSVAKVIGDISKENIKLNFTDYIDVSVTVKNENEEIPQVAASDKQLKQLSSNGLNLLILINLFVAVKNVIKKDQSSTLLWAVDEIDKIHSDNVKILISVLKEENIEILTAAPEAKLETSYLFNHLYDLQIDGSIDKFVDHHSVTPMDCIQEIMAGAGD